MVAILEIPPLKLQLPRVLAGASFPHLVYGTGRSSNVDAAMQQVLSYFRDKVRTEGFA